LYDHSWEQHGESIAPNIIMYCVPKIVGGHATVGQGQMDVYLRSNSINKPGKLENIIDRIKSIVEGGAWSHKDDGTIKDVLIDMSDNASDVGPGNRANQVLDYYIFKLFNLQILVHVSFAARCSKYNPVEMLMTYISKALLGVKDIDQLIYGDHAGKTVDEEKRKKNHKAGMTFVKDLLETKKVKGNKLNTHVMPFEETFLKLKGSPPLMMSSCTSTTS